MDEIEIRLECLRLAAGRDCPDPIAWAELMADFVLGTRDAEVPKPEIGSSYRVPASGAPAPARPVYEFDVDRWDANARDLFASAYACIDKARLDPKRTVELAREFANRLLDEQRAARRNREAEADRLTAERLAAD